MSIEHGSSLGPQCGPSQGQAQMVGSSGRGLPRRSGRRGRLRCGDRLGAMAIAVQTSWRPELAVQTSNLRIITWRVEWPIEFL